MYITITLQESDGCWDLRIDDRQKISAAAGTLKQAGRTGCEPPDFYRSRMQRRLVSSRNTFAQERVMTGDRLERVDGAESAT